MATTQVTRTELFRSAVISAIAPNTHQSIRFSGFLTILYAVSVFLPEPLPGTTAIQAALGFVLLTFVPGLLILRIIRDRFRPIDMLYAVALSLAFSMFVAWLANAIYRQFQIIPKPFTGTTLVWIYVGVISVLTALAWYLTRNQTPVDEIRRVFAYVSEYNRKVVLILLTLPVFGIAGALFINRADENAIALVVIAICAVLPLLAIQFDKKGRYLGLTILALSFALVLQRALLATHLAFGDGVAEYTVASQVLGNGYWVPGGAKDAMPRVALLHPLHKLMMDISLLWEFKLVHPIVFSLTPFAGYKLASRYFAHKTAFLGAVLYVFLPETYRLLPRNTRTGSAIFFAVIFVAVALDSDLSPPLRKVLSVVLIWAIITSHYGLGPLFMMLLGPGVILYYVLVFTGSERTTMIAIPSMALYGVLTYFWYQNMTGGTFNFVVMSIYRSVIGFLSPSDTSSAGNAIALEMPSLSYEILFYMHLLFAVLACLSLAIIGLSHLLHTHLDSYRFKRAWFLNDASSAIESTSYISIIAGITLLFPASFVSGAISSARAFGFLFPFLGVFSVRLLKIPKISRGSFTPAFVLLAVLLLFTSGFVSATVTHDLSRQPNLNRDEIINSNDTTRQFGLYPVYNTERNVQSSAFIASHAPERSTIYASYLGNTNFVPEFIAIRNDIQTRRIEKYEDVGIGYTLISEGDTVTGTITTDHHGFVSYDWIQLREFPENNQIYHNGKEKILI